MHDNLLAAYGPQSWWPATTPFEVILGAYLTQNTAWKAVERSLANLHAAGAMTIDGIRSLSTRELQEFIRPSGFAPRKAEQRVQLFNEFHALTVAVRKAHCGRVARCEGCPLAADLKVAGSSRKRSANRD
jgi:endonuclease III-like uncharacterized protein